jgi:hypothetical protein
MMTPMTTRWTTRRKLFLAGGLALWLAVAVLLAAQAAAGAPGSSALGRALRFVTAAPRTLEAELPVGSLQPGDRVLRFDGAGFRACGEVVSVQRPVGGATVRLALYPDAGLPSPLPAGTSLRLLDSRGTLEWALARIFSPARRARLAEELRTMVSDRGGWLREAFGPVLEEFARGVVADVTASLVDFVRTHETELRELADELLAKARVRWEPILLEMVWPRLLAKLEPIGSAIAAELWDQLPLAEMAKAGAESLGGSLVNWALPANLQLDANRIQKWRDDFIRDKVIPTVERHVPEALQAAVATLEELAAEPRVREALRASFFDDALGNPQLLSLLGQAFSAAVLANQRLDDRLQRLLDDPRVQRGLFDLAEQLGPRLVALARSFLLDESGTRLHPELAMLARVRLIGSEGNWVLLELPPPGTSPPPAPPGSGTPPLVIRPYADSTTPIWERPLP